jgi:hypothetical protein
MSNTRTSVCGAIAAAAGALAAVPGLPDKVHLSAVATAAVAVALLGFFAADAQPSPRIGSAAARLVCALGIAAALCSCAVTGFKLTASSPTFGSIDLSIGGGSIGDHTNTPPPIETNAPPL